MSGTSRAAVIIFGAALRPDGSPTPTLTWRVQAAARFGEQLRVPPLYLPTGGIGRHGPSEASAMAALLHALGVPESRIRCEETATDTLDSVRACDAQLRAMGHAGPVFAATSAYHLPRCLVLLRLQGLAARPVPPPEQPASQQFLRRWRWRLREVPALPWDVLLLLGQRVIDRHLTKR